MDSYEATKTVLSRIQSLDPENASKIMGYLLIQDQGDKEMIRLAFGPENLLISIINQAKTRLGLLSNTSSAPSTPSSSSPFSSLSNANKFNPFPESSPRIMIPNNGFQSSPVSSPWSGGSPPVFSRSPRPVSYAAVVNGSCSGYEDQLFDPIMSPSGRSDTMGFCEENQEKQFHRRSCSVNDVFLGGFDENGNNGFGWRPCMYYARGFCKNGNSCKFMHGGFGDSTDESVGHGHSGGGGAIIGSSPSNVDCFDELMRVKALQQQRFAASSSQFMPSGGRHPFGYNRCMNIFSDNQRSSAAALMMSDEFHKHGRSLPDRNDFSAMAMGGISSSCLRQIYLTFPADSTFKEEDVSNYFSMYGPVQDVRIPYQQKRMFGFVTFIYPETVKLILAKGNPHFVCDSRVLVKPYKEKGKIPDKKQFQLQQQPIDREELSACLSPSGLECRELYDIPFGARMFYNPHEMMLRRKIEQDAELQQAIEFQGRRLMNLQLMKNHYHNNHFHPGVVSPGVPSASQMQNQFQNNQGLVCSSNGINQEALAENNGVQEPIKSAANAIDENQEMPYTNIFKNVSCSKEQTSNTDDSDPQESFDHNLPDNLFASPTKSAAEQHVAFSTDSAAADVRSGITTPATTTTTNIHMLPTTSAFNMASLKSCYFQVPRFTSGQEATET
ncbi:zinc finger CCCH domain-containing protein 53-like isoform X2 [Solanum dulcamara]|uniref:zinc finger CCCH domain-containing protein 53-like isoform X2 n=1 Tax=Solanum dulcamara TaxID=45834 RepID=UPI00248694B9|nr:zinc finger CCCH domain-containing protein 53-like isoform X2 [Solanum dulcamara]